MLVKEQSKSLFPPKPQSFAALMEMYELNYIQLRLLLGDLESLPEYCVAQVPEHIPIALTILERSRHTTTLMLSYCFKLSQSVVEHKAYDLQLKVYHDSQQVEVIQKPLTKNSNTFLQPHNSSLLLKRWRENRLLFKWIKYLRRLNYQFS